jgi:O-antigen/teichoic acid export membrane protein
VLFPFDKLKLYAILIFLSTLLIALIYRIICIRKYEESHFVFTFDKPLFKTILAYSGWNLFGAVAGVCRSHGINILLNLFFGPVINSARAIAYQVNGAINQFVSNFYQAVRPQITKQYATNETKTMMSLVFRSSRFCYYLILLLSMPVLFETQFILQLWLKSTPDYVVLFTRLVIITSLIESISNPLMTSVQATGKIKWYQIVTGGLLLMNLPVSWFFLKCGYAPEVTMYISMSLAIISQLSRILFMKKILHMSIKSYMKDVIWIISRVTLFSYLIPVIFFFYMDAGLIRFITIVCISMITCGSAIYLVGMTKNERNIIVKYVRKYAKITKL